MKKKRIKRTLLSLIGVFLVTGLLFQQPGFAAEIPEEDIKTELEEYSQEADIDAVVEKYMSETDLSSEAVRYLCDTDLSAEAIDVLVTTGLSTEAIEFLLDKGVSFKSENTKTLNGLEALCSTDPGLNGLNESILSLKEDVEVYNFSEEQVQKYVEGLITTTPIVAFSKENALQNRAIVNGPESGRGGDGDGAGYEVKSNAGYYKSTVFGTLPTFSNFYNYNGNRDKRTAGYMMFTMSGAGLGGLDLGISYSKGNSSTDNPQFYVFYYDPSNSSKDPNQPGGVAKFKEYYTQRTLAQGQNVYVKVEKFESGSRQGYLNLSVLNAADFSTVYASLDYYIGSKFVPRTGVINRQITLCDGSRQFNNGTKMNNAVFWDAYIYSTSGYNSTNDKNTAPDRRGAFPDSKNITTVNVNWHEKWDKESVNLSF